MPLTMHGPWQHLSTHVWYLWQRTPLDLVSRLKGRTFVLLTGAEPTETRIDAAVQVSFRTKDNKTAKALHTAADAALRIFWDAQRTGPTSPSLKQAAALTGTPYAAFTAALGDDPGSPKFWAATEMDDRGARLGVHPNPLTTGPVDRIASARNFRYGHLLEQGVLEFARSRGGRSLFYDPGRHSGKATTDPPEIRSRKMAAWVRETVKLNSAVEPDHAWRHTWKSTALGVGIAERISDAITGHSVKAVSRGYEPPHVKMLAESAVPVPEIGHCGRRGPQMTSLAPDIPRTFRRGSTWTAPLRHQAFDA